MNHIVSLDQLDRPEWRVLSTSDLFAEDTMGRYLFPRDLPGALAGRRRTKAAIERAMQQSLGTIQVGAFTHGRKFLCELEAKGIITINDFFAWKSGEDEFNRLQQGQGKGLQAISEAFVSSLLKLPHVSMLAELFGAKREKPWLIPQEDEERIMRIVETAAANQKNAKIAAVLFLRFGLYSGASLTLKETSEFFYWKKEYSRQLEAKGLRILRHPSRSGPLKAILPPVATVEWKNLHLQVSIDREASTFFILFATNRAVGQQDDQLLLPHVVLKGEEYDLMQWLRALSLPWQSITARLFAATSELAEINGSLEESK